jgi:hypothetical protein
MLIWTTTKPYRPEAQSFFYEHAGWSFDPKRETETEGRLRCARELAQAELWAHGPGGLAFEWVGDLDADSYCQCGEDHGPAYGCIVRRKEGGEVLASLWGITFDGTPGFRGPYGSHPYVRVVEAELADEAMCRTRDREVWEMSNPELRALIAYASA